MSFETGFLSLMPFSVTLASWTGYSTDGYGLPAFGTGTTYRARVSSPGARDLIRYSTGQTMTSKLVAWVATTRAVDLRDRFTYAGSTYRIVGVERPPDEDGVHHLKLYLGR